jgi:acyl-CoA synthetase
VAAIGVADPILGERLCAVVVPRAAAAGAGGADGSGSGSCSVTLADLVGFLRERRVASFKLPERLVLVGELPRNPSGKVLKRELRARFATAQPPAADLDREEFRS